MALALAAVALHPEAAEGLKQILLLLWCFGESVMDLRRFSGKASSFDEVGRDMAAVIGVCIPDWFGGRRDGGDGCTGTGMTYMRIFTDLCFL